MDPAGTVMVVNAHERTSEYQEIVVLLTSRLREVFALVYTIDRYQYKTKRL
jgi:hypothetical protein